MTLRLKQGLLYLMFVGVPLAVLVWVLHAGRNLQAPESVAGRWKVDPDPNVVPAVSCGPDGEATRAGDTDPVVLEISQSGRRLSMAVAGMPLHGEIRGTHVMAKAKTKSTHLDADVDRHTKPDALTGTIEAPSCGARVPIRAVRETAANGKGPR
jgi:hypothetical protein